ncbi:hypothetical protein [Bosea sp. PAMC 26642]|uniref:hypothetical protein n=1 Tax=Bosea sp. (strain PAMC 26642) TaxID=1792307 RepID=UPI0007704AD0|nr:hypothetical protein [Bosea sp. PAMC 26642]AMJ61861.1 hypothetical protein AXW83_17530 [Bosea sp. PAMC 26642]
MKPLLFGFAGLAALPLAVTAQEPCRDAVLAAPVVRLSGIDRDGDPVLGDGRTLRLVGLAPRQDAEEAARFASEIAAWSGRELRLLVLAGRDRWGRLPARLYTLSDASDPLDLAEAVLQAKAARRLPDPAYPPCNAEKKRPGPAGVASPYPAATSESIVDGHDIAALKVQAGRIVVLEGRIASVGERAQRTYLNFSRRRGEAASIVMSRGLWREMQDAGWTAAGLGGKRIRARGVLAGQDGLLLDVTSRTALDLID